MVYVIGRPINGISINGLEYLLDENDKIIEFNDRDDCIKYITKNVTDSDPEDFLWEKKKVKQRPPVVFVIKRLFLVTMTINLIAEVVAMKKQRRRWSDE